MKMFTPILIFVATVNSSCSGSCPYQSKSEYIKGYEQFMKDILTSTALGTVDWEKASANYEVLSSRCYCMFREELTIGEAGKLKAFSATYYALDKSEQVRQFRNSPTSKLISWLKSIQASE